MPISDYFSSVLVIIQNVTMILSIKSYFKRINNRKCSTNNAMNLIDQLVFMAGTV